MEKQTVVFQIDVAGCPSSCRHCWARSGPYSYMPLAEVEKVLKKADEVCKREKLNFAPFPFNEVLNHPDPVGIIKLFKNYNKNTDNNKLLYKFFPTSGIALGKRNDWQEILKSLKELGTNIFAFHFHGLDEVHDKIARRKGAFNVSIKAVDRVKSMSFDTMCNVYVTRNNLHQIDKLIEKFNDLELEMHFMLATYTPHKRGRDYYKLIPDYNELLPYADKIKEATNDWNNDKWANLENYTEANYIHRVFDLGEEITYGLEGCEDYIDIVCDNNLDIYTGSGKNYIKYYGNLKDDDSNEILTKSIEDGKRDNNPRLTRYFKTGEFPPAKEILMKYGDPHGKEVFFHDYSLMIKLLDRALKDYRRY